MNSYSRILLILLLAFQILPSQTKKVQLCGRVLDATTNQPINGAIVKISTITNAKITNELGFFYFENLIDGEYKLSINHIAFIGHKQNVTIDSKVNDTIHITIILKPQLFHSDEVVVRSMRTLSTKSDTPYPIDIKLSENLTKISKATISDILAEIPGIAVVRDGTWQTAVSIRGLSRSNIISLINNTRIETANDIAGALSLININDFERVESIKSSGSVLYGTGALGGILHFITKQPSFSEQSKINAELTNSISSVNNELSHYTAIEGMFERFALRISGGYRNAGNTQTPSGMLPNSQYKDFSLSSSLGIKTFGEQSFFISYQRSQAEDAGIPGGSMFGTTSIVKYKLARRELFSAEYKIPDVLQQINLLSIRVSHQEITRNVEIIQNPIVTVTPHAIHSTTSAQIETKMIPALNHSLVIGAEVWQRQLDSRRERYLKSQNKIIGERPIPESKFLNAGFFIQDKWKLLPNEFILTTGARYDWIKVSNEKTYNPDYVISSGVFNKNIADSTVLWNKTIVYNESWSANTGFNYFFNSQIALTFLIATAFRSPSLEERYQFLDLGNGFVNVGDPNLQPERSLNLNVGVRLNTDKFRIQSDIFLNQLKNLIKDRPGFFEGRPALIKSNIGKARIYGYEFLSKIFLFKYLTFNYSLAYVRGEDVINNTNLPQITPLTGEIALESIFSRVGIFNLTCLFSAEQSNIASGEQRTPGYGIFNFAYVSNTIEILNLSATLRAGIQNIFNKTYRNHLSTLRGIVKDEPGRNYYMSIALLI